MVRCANEKCNNDPTNSMNTVIINIDGDLACCPECKTKYEEQRDNFFNNIVQSESATLAWLGVNNG